MKFKKGDYVYYYKNNLDGTFDTIPAVVIRSTRVPVVVNNIPKIVEAVSIKANDVRVLVTADKLIHQDVKEQKEIN